MTAPDPTTRNRNTTLIVVAGATALAIGLWLGLKILHPTPTPPQNLRGTWLSAPHAVPAFALKRHDGQPFNNDSLQGQWTLMFFGYTHCPDICPTTMAVLNNAVRKLGQPRKTAVPTQVVFMTVDPERDTIEQLAQFVPHFNPEFVGVTGPLETIRNFTRSLGILYMHGEKDAATGSYLVDHSASILLFDPQGQMSAIFSPPHDPTALAEDLLELDRYYGERS